MTTQLEHSHVNLLYNYVWVVPSNVVETIYGYYHESDKST